MIKIKDWATFKSFLDIHSIPCSWVDVGHGYFIKADNVDFQVENFINKTNPKNADQIEFEANYKPFGNIKKVDKNGINNLVLAPSANKRIAEGDLFKRCHGMGELVLDPGEVGDFEFQIPYGWAKLIGISIMDQVEKLQAELYIEDDDNGLYSGTGIARTPLNQFGIEVEIPKNFFEKKSEFDSDLYFGMWVVLQVTNTGAVQQTIRANIELNEVRTL